MASQTTDEIIENIRRSTEITSSMGFEYAKYCSSLLKGSSKDQDEGRKIVINILDNWDKLSEEIYELWTDLIEVSGFYPYLEKEKSKINFDNTIGEIRKELHKAEFIENTYFHEEQKILTELFSTDKNLIVSAPTSFGKSLIIEEIVASRKYKNIVIIQPTLALLDESRKKLKKYFEFYKIIVRTSQVSSEIKGNLFLLTAERVMEYPSLPKIDLLIIDEFYKLSEKRKDERSDVLNNAFHKLLKEHNVKFYLLGPNIKNISEGFAEAFNAVFFKTNYNLVDNVVIDVTSGEYGSKGQKKRKKEDALFQLLVKLKDEQNIIYCSSPAKARYLSRAFCDYVLSNNLLLDVNHNHHLNDWIKENVNKDWSLIPCLKKGIAFHDGALQKHITSTIIKYFNDGSLNFLFCTSTIIEGVNTSAKNVVVFDSSKGGYSIDFFDYCNIKGRAGRMMVHYVGRIFNFNEIPEESDLIVDIPFFEQNPIKDEVLIHLTQNEIKNKDSNQYKELMKIPDDERELFRKNGLSVKGQKKILDYIYTLIDKDIIINDNRYPFSELIYWNFPNYDQLQFILELCWEYLKNDTESLSIHSASQLTQRVMSYAISKNIHVLLIGTLENYKEARQLQSKNWHKKYKNMTDLDLLEEATRDTFQVLKHWFQYKVPKWLRVMDSIIKHICIKRKIKKGDFTFFANQLENDFVRENLSILIEYGIPRTAVEKIGLLINYKVNEDDVIKIIMDNKLYEIKELLPYEKEKILDSL